MVKIKKKILLINTSGGYQGDGFIPHLGLAYLGRVLKNYGHRVLILDYNGKRNLPSLETVVEKLFGPDIIGVSTYSTCWLAASNLLDRLQKYNLPIIVGGPHVSCCKERILADARIDSVITGEAENIILEAVNNLSSNGKPKLFEGAPVDVKLLPYPDFTSFYLYEKIDSYPLITSRGCPFACSFCAVGMISSKKWRAREINSCIDELKVAFKKLPELKRIIINDDNFSLDLNRAKDFLNRLIALELNLKLEVSNVRADRVDEEFILLLKKAGCKHIGIGIEHSDPQVYNHIGKSEKIEDIIKAAKLIKKYRLSLGVCMVVGLPYDSLEKIKEAVRFVKQIKADAVFWNMVYPFCGTRVRKWFEENGKIFEDREQGFTPRHQGVLIDEPVVETVDFVRAERRKAYTMAVLETGMYSYKDLILLIKSLPYIISNNLFKSLISGFIYGFRKRIGTRIR